MKMGEDPEILRVISLDGASVHGVLVDHNSERSFDISSPRKGAIDYLFMKMLFDKMDATFKKPETIKYLEQLRKHFPYGLN